MVRFTFRVKDEGGLQAKQAGELVSEAAKCTGEVRIRKGEKTGNAKLIFNVLTLSAKENDEVEISVSGDKETEEAAALEAFVGKYHILVPESMPAAGN